MRSRAITFFAVFGAFSAHAAELTPPQPAANPALLAHQERFSEPEMISVKEKFHVAHGFDMCNIIFVEGPEGLIVMDTGFRVEKAETAIAAIREITDKPIKAVFYSHGHGDHVGGSGAFRAAAPEAEFIAHEGWQRNINHISSALRPTYTLRAFAQLGMMLPEGVTGTVGSGGGPILRAKGTMSYVAPTRTVADGEWLEIAGLKFQALHTPGDLDDGLSLWFPEDKVVLTGDTITHSHVHVILSTPRHEPGRQAQEFVTSLTRLGALGAEVLIGGHGDVVEGKDEVAAIVRSDRRSAQFMIDEVMRYIRLNKSGADVQSNFAYPDWFLEGEDRGDYYHKLSWITRGVYAEYMGWFNGDGTGLAPVAPSKRASNIVSGFGGPDAATEKLEQAYQAGDYAWANELASYILITDPKNTSARQLKAWSLKGLAYASESANERNYLLTQAFIMEGKIPIDRIRKAAFRRGLPQTASAAETEVFLHTLGARLKVEAAKDINLSFEIKVTDRGESYFIEIDKGVLLTSPVVLTPTTATLKLGFADLARVAEGLASFKNLKNQGKISIAGDDTIIEELNDLF